MLEGYSSDVTFATRDAVFLAIFFSLENVKSVPPGGAVAPEIGVRTGVPFRFKFVFNVPCTVGIQLVCTVGMFGDPKLSPSFKKKILFLNKFI